MKFNIRDIMQDGGNPERPKYQNSGTVPGSRPYYWGNGGFEKIYTDGLGTNTVTPPLNQSAANKEIASLLTLGTPEKMIQLYPHKKEAIMSYLNNQLRTGYPYPNYVNPSILYNQGALGPKKVGPIARSMGYDLEGYPTDLEVYNNSITQGGNYAALVPPTILPSATVTNDNSANTNTGKKGKGKPKVDPTTGTTTVTPIYDPNGQGGPDSGPTVGADTTTPDHYIPGYVIGPDGRLVYDETSGLGTGSLYANPNTRYAQGRRPIGDFWAGRTAAMPGGYGTGNPAVDATMDIASTDMRSLPKASGSDHIKEARRRVRDARKDIKASKRNQRQFREWKRLNKKAEVIGNLGSLEDKVFGKKMERKMMQDDSNLYLRNLRGTKRIGREAIREDNRLLRDAARQKRLAEVVPRRQALKDQRVTNRQYEKTGRAERRNMLRALQMQQELAASAQKEANRANAAKPTGNQIKWLEHMTGTPPAYRYGGRPPFAYGGGVMRPKSQEGGRQLAQNGINKTTGVGNTRFDPRSVMDPTIDAYQGPLEPEDIEARADWEGGDAAGRYGELNLIYPGSSLSKPTIPGRPAPFAKSSTTSTTPTAPTHAPGKGGWAGMHLSDWGQLAGSMIPAIYNLSESFKPPAHTDPMFNPELPKVYARQAARRANMDKRPLHSAMTAQRQALQSQSGNIQAKNAMMLAANAGMQDRNRELEMARNQMDAQFAGQADSTAVRMGAEKVGELQRTDAANRLAEVTRDQLRNKAVTQIGAGVVHGFDRWGRQQQNALEMNMLNQIYKNYGTVGYNAILSGAATEGELARFKGNPAMAEAYLKQKAQMQQNLALNTQPTVEDAGADTQGIDATRTTTYDTSGQGAARRPSGSQARYGGRFRRS